MTRSLPTFLATWGNGQHGRLGHAPSLSSELFPRLVASLRDVVAASCGGAHTAAVTAGGALFTFGINGHGQLGHNEDLKFVAEPTEALIPDRVVAVSAGEAHTLALSDAGEVWAAGSNDAGQLGLGSGVGAKNAEFRLVRALRGVRVMAVAAGAAHSLALSASGAVYAWGDGTYGQLGLGRNAASRHEHVPSVVRALDGVRVRSVAAGAYHSGCVVDANNGGGARLWGHGASGQLGLGNTAHWPVPQELPQPRLVASLALGFAHSIAVGTFGQAATWGADEHGCLGQGFRWPAPPLLVPTALRNSIKLASAAAGWMHSAGIGAGSGELYTWGWAGAPGGGGLLNPSADLGGGQLGTGDDRDAHEPARVQRLTWGTGGRHFIDLRGGAGGEWAALSVACARTHTAAVVAAPVDYGDVDAAARR